MSRYSYKTILYLLSTHWIIIFSCSRIMDIHFDFRNSGNHTRTGSLAKPIVRHEGRGVVRKWLVGFNRLKQTQPTSIPIQGILGCVPVTDWERSLERPRSKSWSSSRPSGIRVVPIFVVTSCCSANQTSNYY